MHRRDFAITLALTPFAGTLVQAATPVVAGQDYTLLPTAMPVAVPGKIEVIEFFGYWCPHCKAFEPKLQAWVKALPRDVAFRRVPVAWQEGQVPYQKLFYALEAMGAPQAVQPLVFKAFHEQHVRFNSDADVAALATAIGVDKTKLTEAFKAFSVDAKIRLANQQTKSYQIEGVPSLAVNGLYVTSPEMAKGEAQALQVLDALIQKARTRR